MQIRDVLPAEPDSLAAVAAQITELALERANDNQARQTEALQNALSTRDAQAAELQVSNSPQVSTVFIWKNSAQTASISTAVTAASYLCNENTT